MAQKTNLNVNPYFDDFAEPNIGAKDKNYQKVLFNPGKPIQARELNTLQSILQDQVESFGSHIFKDGSVVIPGSIVYDGQFTAVKLNPIQYGVDITAYIKNLVGKTIIGQDSGITASVQLVQLPNSEVEYSTLYIKYLNSDSNFEINSFLDGELLYTRQDIVYQSTVITSGTPFASTIDLNSTSTGSAASINAGIYFIRGSFVRVKQQTIILDYYTNTPSYRVGLKIDEKIITSKDDSSLFDNAKGFTNYAAPGADRFQVNLTLTKRSLTDTNDIDFVELLRIQDGAIKKIETKTVYSNIRDYLAQRTHDESGDYVVTPFQFSLNNSLNNRVGNDGLFFDTEKTERGNVPSDDLMSIKISPGKAYVKGYDVEKTGVEIIDVLKPRTTEPVSSAAIPFQMGNLVRSNNVTGSPLQKNIVYLQNRRKNSTIVATGTTAGFARIYNFNVTDAAYTSAATNWDLYLYDIQTFTELTINKPLSSAELPVSSFIRGKSSGASGYAVYAGNGSTLITLSQTSGSFSAGEKLLINEIETVSRTLVSVKAFTSEDVKSVHQPTSISGFSTAFLADLSIDKILRSGTITITPGSGGISTATVSSPNTFTGIRSDNIIRYQKSGSSTETYNRVLSISSSLTSMTLEAVPSVTGVCDGSLPGAGSTFTGTYSIGAGKIRNSDKGFLYAELPHTNISSVNLSSSNIIFTAQSTGTLVSSASGSLTVNTSNFNLGINTVSAKFSAFDEERYSIFYSDGTIENLTSDKVSLNSSSSQVTFSNITPSKSISAINATFVKNSIETKIKKLNKSKKINIIFSKKLQSGTGINTSINDGLIYNPFYGLRVQDTEISLNYPDVSNIIAIYESLDTNAPELDKFVFSSLVDVNTNAIIGENIVGSANNAVARVVSKPSANTLEIVYLNNNIFSADEIVTFKESNIITPISSITPGKYRNITNRYTLDKGQKEQYYDYSRIRLNSGEQFARKKLIIIFDHYLVPTNDNGDVFTVNSYDKENYNNNIPVIGKNNIRSTDTLDFRPRVSEFTSITSSPFDFTSRLFGTDPKLIMTPDESSIIGYEFYLGRIDKLFIDKNSNFTVIEGVPSSNPKAPDNPSDTIEIASISLPPYLYNPKDAIVTLVDNRRYTMRDIGKIDGRVTNLEKVTSLTLLELNTKTLQITDADGLNRFKTGFFVDDFKNTDLINGSFSKIRVDGENSELVTQKALNTLDLKPVSLENITDQKFDLETNFTLYDTNVQKTGDLITLKYDSVGWIEQLFATKVENVNPFHVVSYSGTIQLSPKSDSWVRTIRLPDINVSQTNYVWLRATGTFRIVGSETTVTKVDKVVDAGIELYMRSRNTGFNAVNLKPLTKYYQFLDGNGSVNFIPKLIEIATDSTLKTNGASGAFEVGETVIGYVVSRQNSLIPIITFRVAKSNHKEGPFSSPTITFSSNPYSSSENIPASYSSSSKILNVDIASLCQNVQGLYSGYLNIGAKLVGQTSKSVAYVKDLRLISDVNGFLSGSFFLQDPNTNPAPSIRIATGSKVYKLTSSSTNETPLPGSTLISSGETIYKSEGTWEKRQTTVTTTTTVYFEDPLAQSFTVGGANAETSFGNTPTEDVNGAYLTEIDLYFANKDPGNAPLTVQIRTMELGTPTLKILGDSVTLQPSDINVSNNASVATRVKFKYPIYLAPGLEYAVVLLAPQSDQYEAWIAEMGEKTIETKNLPNSQAVKYSRQFAMGSLFKSQNGSIWTANQYQDLKFKLYKARFSSTSGSAYFHNPTLNESNSYVPKLSSDPLVILPRQIKVGINTVTISSLVGILTEGRKISGSASTTNYGYIIGTGSSVSSVNLTRGGLNYTTTNNVETFNLTGRGSGLKLNIVAANGVITGTPTISIPGNGYVVGDVVGIVTSSVSPASGKGALITISTITGVDTLYLSNVQGQSLSAGNLIYYDTSGTAVSLANTSILSSTPIGGTDTGNFIAINHHNHGMYGNTNKLILSNIESDSVPTTLSSELTISGTFVSIASTSNFNIFEGVQVGATNPGFIIIDSEIIKYTSIGNGTLNGITRGIDSTIPSTHGSLVPVYKYELGGVSLLRINKKHDISDTNIDIDNYFINFSRNNFNSNVTNRQTDGSLAGAPQLSFNTSLACGGDNVRATENIQFDSITPQLSVSNPASVTAASGQIRTVSGTSVDGTETSFLDQGYESVELGVENKLSSTRIICSDVNEKTYLSALERNKSFTLKVDLSTTDKNLSPAIFWKESSIALSSNRLNAPISNYPGDNRVNSLLFDPHSAVYVSNTVNLAQPATSLKVIIGAYRHSSADFRVLYSLIRPDSSEVDQSFELFPGYNNLTIDSNNDGYFDVIDPSDNNGLPDIKVPDSLENQFLDYEFSANNLGSFTGYTIKIVMSGTNQAYPPRFQDLRSIALAWFQ